MAFLGHYVQAQCAAYGYFTQSGASAVFYDSSYSVNGHEAYWLFGDSTSGSYGTQVSHTYTANGTYTACLFIYDTIANCNDTACYTVTITSVNNSTSTCNASFVSNVDSSNSFMYHFDGSTPPAFGSSSFTIGNTGISDTTYYSQNTSHTFASAGNYSIRYVLYDSTGNMCDSVEITFAVSGSNTVSCNASFNYSVDASNAYKLNFNNTSTNAVTAYWWFGGSSSSNLYNPSHTFNTIGYQTVCLTTYDSSGNLCDSVCQSVYVSGASSNSFCDAIFYADVSGNAVTFYDSLTPNSILEYSFGDGTYGYSYNPTHTYDSSGTYTACLFVYDVDSIGDTLLCDSFCQTVTIAATSNCTASFSAYPDSVNMSASSYPVVFDNNSTGVNYLWNFGDGSSDTAQNPTHTYTTAGTYTVCLYVLTAYDNLGLPIICDSICTTVTVGGSTIGCQASYYLGIDTNNLYNLYIIENSTGTSSTTNYSWSFGDGSTSTVQYPTHQYSTFGLYNLCLTLSDSVSGCSSTYCDSIGLDSNGNLLKRDGFGITVVDEKVLLSIADIDLINELSVYPNPSNGSFTLKLNLRASEEVSIKAINSLGQEVLARELSGLSGANEYSIDMTAQVNGIYFLNVRAGDQSKNIKLYINE